MDSKDCAIRWVVRDKVAVPLKPFETSHPSKSIDWCIPPCPPHHIDDEHEQLGAIWLIDYFVPEVVEPVRLHVAAKRYLCHTDPWLLRETEPTLGPEPRAARWPHDRHTSGPL
jgi:hypothetical protein